MQKLQATDDLAALMARAAHLLAAGRIGAARPLLAAAGSLAPDSVALADLSARLALRAETPDAAAAQLDRAIAAAPDNAELRKRRAELRRQAGDVEGAARDAAEAVVLARTDPAAKALLGVLMLELNRTRDAIACLYEASADEPGNAGFATALAAAYEAAGDSDAALEVLLRNIEAAPGLADPRNAAILLCVRRRDFRTAIALAEAARRAGIADACSFGLLGHALSSLGRHAEAVEAYVEALKLGPDDPYVRHLVSAAGVVPRADRAPAAYLRAVFDGYADRFESHLISLGYRVPGLFRAVLEAHPALAAGEATGPVLDLGCGTGLAAVALSGLAAGPLIGIDVSPRMLARARQKGLYAELIEADVLDALRNPLPSVPHGAALILAADVLCYFGALEPMFAATLLRLAPGGWLIASTEELLPDHDGVIPGDNGGQWALLRQGRYAHGLGYVRDTAVAAGFSILRLERQTIRYEAGVPVAGLLIVLQRSAG